MSTSPQVRYPFDDILLALLDDVLKMLLPLISSQPVMDFICFKMIYFLNHNQEFCP